MLLIQLQNGAKKKNKYIRTFVESYYYNPGSFDIKMEVIIKQT